MGRGTGREVAPIIRRTLVGAAQHPWALDRLPDMDDDAVIPTTSGTVHEAGFANVEASVDDGRSLWFKVAFIALVGALVLLGTSGVGAAAYSLIAGDPYACGGG